MQQRIIPFHTMEKVLHYANYILTLAGATVMFVLPNAIVIQYNGQAILLIARDHQGD